MFDITVESASEAGQAGKFRNILENMLGTTELYCVSNFDHRVYSFAKAVNPTKWIAEIDLSECTDITILDRLRLVPLYGIENRLPTFTVRGFVDKLCSRHRWPSDYKDEMVKIFEDEVVPKLAPILNLDDGSGNRIFRDVTLEKIERDVIDFMDARGDTKNPEWVKWSDTRIRGSHRHKNLVWDNNCKEDGECQVHMMAGFAQNINYSTLSDEEKTDLQKTWRGWLDETLPLDAVVDKFMVNDEYISWCNSLVYLPNEYKLVSKDDTTDFLDFTKNDNDGYFWFALIPNYDANSYVLSTMSIADEINNVYNLKMDPKNPAYADRGSQPVTPVIFNEITSVKEEDVELDWKKAGEGYFKAWKFLGKDVSHPKKDGKYLHTDRSRNTFFRYRGAEILSRGYAFMALNDNVNES